MDNVGDQEERMPQRACTLQKYLITNYLAAKTRHHVYYRKNVYYV